jgi:alpha-D-ribose 1-methylphosphonate 5-triphosphate synthase subunit PhnH
MTTASTASAPTAASGARASGIPTALTPAGAQAVFRATLDVLARPGTIKRLPSAADEPLAEHVPAALLPLLALADLSTPTCVVDGATGGAKLAGTGGGSAAKGADEATVTHDAADLDSDADGRTTWDEIVRVATNAPRAALGDARLVAALRPLTAEELAGLRTGTAAAPENGALACLAVTGIATADGTDGTATADGTDGTATADSTDGTATADSTDGTATADSTDGVASADDEALLLWLSGPGVPGTRAVTVTGLPAGFAAARRRLVQGFPAGADLLLIAPDGTVAGLPRTTEVSEETA